jgi:hypothetical protein
VREELAGSAPCRCLRQACRDAVEGRRRKVKGMPQILQQVLKMFLKEVN